MNNRMIIYGGCLGGCPPIQNNVWVLSNANGCGPGSTPSNCLPVTPTWQQLPTPGATPPPREGHQAVYDPNTNSMIVWAGTNGTDPCIGAYSDVWMLSNANGMGGIAKWTQLLTTGGPPAGRFRSTAVYDSDHNIMIVFGGSGLVGPKTNPKCQSTNAVWALSNANGSSTGGASVWKELTAEGATGSPPDREAHVAVYGPSHNTMTIFGGLFTKHQSNFTPIHLGDTWELSNANRSPSGGTPMWTNLFPLPNSANPDESSRWNGGGIDTMNHIMIMFGGSSKEGPLWSTWKLSHPNGL